MGSVLAVCLVIALSAGGEGQEGVQMERVSIENGSGAANWGVAEATVSVSREFAERGETSLLFHIDVDHLAGEPNYPIGWPRIFLKPPEELRDWSQYDFLELVIHSETSRQALPSIPLGFMAHTPDKTQAYNRQLTELKKGETTTIVIPLSSIPRHQEVPHIQFYISESNYQHGDVVDFYIDDIALARYAVPTLSDIVPLQSIAFTDTRYMGLKFRVLGIKEGKEINVKVRAREGAEVVAHHEWVLARGEHEVWIKVDKPLRPGEIALDLYLAEPQEVARVRIIPSPFGEAERGD
ncbi:MAG: hypothetical protein ACUVX8_04175 [Candidatus Zipacnadales bacterium]